MKLECPLSQPTRSYLQSTAGERRAGFVAASAFSVIYYAAPLYIVGTLAYCAFGASGGRKCALAAPLLLSMAVPGGALPVAGARLLRLWCVRQIPKYFRFEEFHEVTDAEVTARVRAGDRFVFCFHPHGVFPFVATCALISSYGAEGDPGSDRDYYPGNASEDFPTAVASVLRWIPLLKDVVGLFGVMDASAAVFKARLKTGSCALYVGGMLELFSSSKDREAVVLSRRKGFVKLALRSGADLIPSYMFGNTTVLSALTAGPLALLSRKLGVSCTVFWGRWGLPLPRPVKLVFARGRPLGLPHIPDPTDADVDKYHKLYCARLLDLFDNYKKFNPDYAHKALIVE